MTSNRSLRPYPPANPVTSNPGTAIRIAWYNRNRLITSIRKQTDPTETLEAGQTTTIKIYGDALTLLRTVTGQTGTSYDYTNANEIADAGAPQNRLIFRVSSVRDGYESLANETHYDRADFVVAGADHVVVGTDRVIV
jgi:hypothetical protein